MATIHYSKAYVGADRSFQATFQGSERSRVLQSFFLGGYSKLYLGNYTKTYDKLWSGTFGAQYSKAYDKIWLGNYVKHYEGTFEGVYDQQWEGSFSTQFAKVWSHQWTGIYEKAYGTQWIKQYTGTYVGQYTGVYTNASAYARQYTGTYIGYYARDGIGSYAKLYQKLWSGSRTYDGQYGATYAKVWTGQYEGSFTGYYSKAYVATWSGQYSKGYASSFQYYDTNYDLQFSKNYTKQWTKTYNKIWVGQYEGQFAGSPTWTGIYAATANYAAQWTGLSWSKTYTGSPTTWSGTYTRYLGDGEQMFYIGAYTGPGSWSKAYVSSTANVWTGAALTPVNYSGSGPLSSPAQSTWMSGGNWGGVGWHSASWTGNAGVERQFQGVMVEAEPAPQGGMQIWYTPFNWSGTQAATWVATFGSDVNYGGGTPIQWTGNWTGTQQYSGLRDHNIPAAYTKQYTKIYTKQYEGTRTFQSPIYYNTYTKLWTGYFEGQSWTKVWSKVWTGQRDNNFDAQYSKLWSGSRTYNGQYTGNYTKHYLSVWIGNWTGQYTGQAIYGTKVTGASFEGVFEGYYDKQWSKGYGASYTKAFSGQYTGYYTKLYTGTFVGQYTGSYTGQYSRLFAKTYEGGFAASYTKLYGKVWTGQFAAQYNKLYLGNYTKTYSSVFLGTAATYLGTDNAQYTKAYTGAVTYNQTSAGTTTVLAANTGHLNTGGQVRVKDQGAWKSTSNIHVKKDNAWHETKAVFVKKDNAWQIMNIGWERTDITITSSEANFHLKNKLTALGKSPDTLPQLVNIYIDGADVYSSSASPAMDLSAGLGSIGFLGTSVKHLVRVFVHPDARIIGMAGAPGGSNAATRTGNDGGNGGDAIKTSGAVELFVENYGIIAGGGGAGGTGGYPVNNSTLQLVGGAGGYGAGYAVISGTLTNILENNSLINKTNAANDMGIHGGDGGLLGQRGDAAGGYQNPNTGSAVAADGALKTVYDKSGNGGLPGAAIDNYNATRVTFINTGNVWGDSKFKYRA